MPDGLYFLLVFALSIFSCLCIILCYFLINDYNETKNKKTVVVISQDKFRQMNYGSINSNTSVMNKPRISLSSYEMPLIPQKYIRKSKQKVNIINTDHFSPTKYIDYGFGVVKPNKETTNFESNNYEWKILSS